MGKFMKEGAGWTCNGRTHLQYKRGFGRDCRTEESIDVRRTLTETLVEWTDHAITLIDVYTVWGWRHN